MFQLSSIFAGIISNISLRLLKSILDAFLTYPINVLILTFILIIATIKSLKGIFSKNMDLRQVRKIKDQINISKSIEGIQQLKKELKEVEEEINKMGIMFGYRSNDIPESEQESKQSKQLRQFLEGNKKSGNTAQKVTKKIKDYINCMLKQLKQFPSQVNKSNGI